jgi:hypothetical protein
VKAVWDGALHILTSPLSIAAMIGLFAIVAGIHERHILAVTLIAAVSAGFAFLISAYLPAYAVPAMVAALGMVGVPAWQPPARFAWVFALFAGLAGGLAAELDAPSIPTIVGVFLTETIILGGVLTGYPDLVAIKTLTPVLPIATRVLGSWVTAIGLLLTALAFHGTSAPGR